MTSDVQPADDTTTHENLSTFPLIAAACLIFLVGDVFVMPRVKEMAQEMPVVAALFFGVFISAQLNLTAIWFALGWISLPMRLIVATISVLLTCYNGPPAVGVSNIFYNYFTVLFAALPCVVARCYGWSIRRPGVVSELAAINRSRGQFTMGEILAWTTFAGIIAATVRFGVWGSLPGFGHFCVIASVALLNGILLPPVLWVALAERRQKMAIVGAVLFSYLWGVRSAAYLQSEPGMMLLAACGPALALLATAGALLLLRHYGFRYERCSVAVPELSVGHENGSSQDNPPLIE